MILIVRDDGVIRVEDAQPVSRSFVETVEHLYRTLDVRPRHNEQQQQHDDKTDGE